MTWSETQYIFKKVEELFCFAVIFFAEKRHLCAILFYKFAKSDTYIMSTETESVA